MPQPTGGHKGLIIAHVALGSNATSSSGSPEFTLRDVKQAISCDSVNVLAESRFFRSPAFPVGSGPNYVNAAITLETSLSADALLAYLHRVEAVFGRVREARWAARTLDLDLLDYGGRILPDAATVTHWVDLPLERQKKDAPDRLILPHPRIQDRAFVLIPLADIAPDWVHPLSGRSLADMLSALPDAEKGTICPL
ncbi:2-amino-4-hydroxy-6-hydroxymethyldihydropteridinediphosphokinase [Litoreibacter ascidiaceicola]|uniref:2-amino-4-hydroxy-6-hydroxymethyldihydropteridine pyrophosphokinase n=1 Tax=Litoreibacter ascidiaceicola TaxID=1486859 RepID=A0A1M4XEB4_9RHOB|nr:2-amino-4-hydroxy-6-hydroxymethyldihydropteridine diphosphokinase [Litoreibacter ascidiaceicola]SHE91758.1 2-amino-4-hydroxy-6-hydroxymethyldihydropteridinediphosphokinase [Litoreibacter ascidiaceicola]